MDAFGYRQGIKEAKRLISEGRAQISSANRLDVRAKLFEDTYYPYANYEKEQDDAYDKKSIAIEKIKQGLEIYRCLLSYENLDHFARIKNGLMGTIFEFKNVLADNVVEKYTNSFYVGPE